MASLRKLQRGMWYGFGIMCGNGYEAASRNLRRSDSETLRRDWERIGGDFRKAIVGAETELDKARPTQHELNLTE